MVQFATAEDDRRKFVSALTQVEARSAICKLRQMQKLTADEASLVSACIDADLKHLTEQPVSSAVLAAAKLMIERHYVRALDALQLGSAIVARDSSKEDMRFIASDRDLLSAAAKEGFEIWNPCD